MSTTPPTERITQPETYAFTAFAAITLYNSIELIILTLATFKKYQGVYFYSLLITSCSLIVNCVGFTLLFFVNVSNYVSVTIILLGWYAMVTGHSVVLWSRLHLVLQCPRILRGVLYLIIYNAVTLCVPTTVLLYGAVTPSPTTSSPADPDPTIQTGQQARFSRGYNIMERIQLVIFALQEILLSAIYIWETAKLLRLRPQHSHRVILMQLLVINVVILGLDIVVVVFQYAGLFAVQVCFKPVAYSIKLRLEYAILGRLVQVAKGGMSSPDVGGIRALNGPGSGSGEVAWPGTGPGLGGETLVDSRAGSRFGSGGSRGGSEGSRMSKMLSWRVSRSRQGS